MKNHKPDLLIDQTVAWLKKRLGQPVDDELLTKFLNYFFPRKKHNDLTIMKDMVERMASKRVGKCPVCFK